MKSPSPDRYQAYRRRFLRATTASALGALFPVIGAAHGGVGILKAPLALPFGSTVVRSDGMRVPLQSILRGKTTALQLMFTGCSETCPLQGALFAGVQERLSSLQAKNIQLLSLSIDPMDDAKSLSSWLRRFGAKKGWVAAVPMHKDIRAVNAVLQQGTPALNNHSSQVYFIDPRGRLVWRSEDLPPVEVVIQILERLT
jgi:protein SCO1/2